MKHLSIYGLCIGLFLDVVVCHEIVVATYNLWNVMYHWEIRKLYIAEMILDIDIDIIGFQEVRAHQNLNHTQIDDLQILLPEYKYKYYHPIHLVQHEFTGPPGWEWEGVGFLSKHQLLTTDHLNLTNSLHSTDSNRRVMLYGQFAVQPGDKELNVVMVHFSYDKIQQCTNVKEVLQYLYGSGVENTVLIGDFNAYEDFEWPVNALLQGRFDEDGPPDQCKKVGKEFDQAQYRGYGFMFLDAWVTANPPYRGFTFSNMPVPGFINRPDRILVSNVGLKIKSTLIRGKSLRYAKRYEDKLWWARLYAVYKSMHLHAPGRELERTCAWDCGPHGSCRCGICISGGDENNCKLSECNECSPQKLSIIYMLIFMLIPCIVSITLTFSLFVLGIFRPRLRRVCKKKLKLRRCLGKNTVIFSVLLIMFFYKIASYHFDDIFTIVSLQLYEELHPSDHLLVASTLDIL